MRVSKSFSSVLSSKVYTRNRVSRVSLCTSKNTIAHELGKSSIVPETAEQGDITQHANTFLNFLHSSKKCLVLSGAGIRSIRYILYADLFSTESGIPDYRSPNGSYSKGHKPVSYAQFSGSHSGNLLRFLSDSQVRQRYWARNLQGWPFFSRCSYNSYFLDSEVLFQMKLTNLWLNWKRTVLYIK